jgi:hypothetical protein
VAAWEGGAGSVTTGGAPGSVPTSPWSIDLYCPLCLTHPSTMAFSFSLPAGLGSCFGSNFNILLFWDAITQSHSTRPRSIQSRHLLPSQAGPSLAVTHRPPHPNMPYGARKGQGQLDNDEDTSYIAYDVSETWRCCHPFYRLVT